LRYSFKLTLHLEDISFAKTIFISIYADILKEKRKNSNIDLYLEKTKIIFKANANDEKKIARITKTLLRLISVSEKVLHIIEKDKSI
jgi:tRNA threonylcarbamoyladenosine modification (KEOPS) complex  Pcc1 subunit